MSDRSSGYPTSTFPRAAPALPEVRRRRVHRAISGVLERPADEPSHGHVHLDRASVPLALCSTEGQLLAISPPAAGLFMRAGIQTTRLPGPLPSELWRLCRSTETGTPLDWYPEPESNYCVALTPYRHGPGQLLLLMSEISGHQQELSARLHKQRLELTGRLVAMIAHDLRVPLSTIVFNAEVAWAQDLARPELQVVLRDVREAAGRMRASIDGLLDFARPGGSRCGSVALEPALERLRSHLHPSLREGGHCLRFDVEPEASHVVSNALLLEQVLVNLVMNAVEAASAPIEISAHAQRVSSASVSADVRHLAGDSLIRLTVKDSGPGIPADLRERIFEPFFTTKSYGTGLGLPMAREAMATIGSRLTLEPSEQGACFALWFVPVEPAPTGES